jgi:hypothetical protein
MLEKFGTTILIKYFIEDDHVGQLVRWKGFYRLTYRESAVNRLVTRTGAHYGNDRQ